MKVSWGKRIELNQLLSVIKCCIALGWKLETHLTALMACIAFETGRTFSPSVKNAAGSGATGLIQFMPTTAKGLKTSTAELAAMSFEEQMSYVERYFKPYASKVKTIEDLYFAIFMPKYIGANLDSVVFNQGTIAYTQNSGFDSSKKGYITVGDITERIRRIKTEGETSANLLEI